MPMRPRPRWLLACVLLSSAAQAQAPNPAGIDWVRLDALSIARTETTIAQFRRFVTATHARTQAEQAGGGQIYEAGWVQKPGWHWAAPFGRPGHDDEPAVHLTFFEAESFCRWAGGRLPRDAEWAQAGHLEQRRAPPAPFVRGQRYAYPTGDTPAGAQCLDDCGPEASQRAVQHGAKLWRGHGHARAGTTRAGVNGLFEMGANAWEWVDDGASGEHARRTRGGSWWYGQAQMRETHLESKPPHTAVAYIGHRCARDF